MIIHKVALYARFSSDNQRTESIDAQIRAMTSYCQQQRWQIVATYVDEAKSATSDNRPDFQKMISDSSKGIFDILLVHKLDRFSRDRYDSAIYKKKLKKNNVRLCSVLERIDDSPESIMMESVLEGMAEYYSKNLSREVMKGMHETALQCKHTGGCCPLGYTLDSEKCLKIEPHEAEAVKIIFEMFDQGYGYSKIINTLNELGFKSKKGNNFGKNSLYEILLNEKYTGVFVYNRKTAKRSDNKFNGHSYKNADEIVRIENGCPQIVSKELFNRVQKRIQANKVNAGRYGSKEFYLLTGKVFCGVCGKRMQGNKRHSGTGKSVSVTYRCFTHRVDCNNKEINRRYLDTYVEELLKEKIFNPKALRKIVKQVNRYINSYNNEYDNNYDKIKSELEEINSNLENVVKAIEKGILTESVVTRAEELEKQKSEIESELSELHKYTPINYEDVAPLIEEFKSLERGTEAFRTFIQQYLGKIAVFPYHLEIELNTGLCLADEVNEIVVVKKSELYEKFEPWRKKQ